MKRPVRVNAWKSLLLAALLALAPAGRAWAVAVSPSALFLDTRSPAGTLTLYNGGSLPEELEISFAFGYPTTGDDGAVRVEMVDTAPAGEPSIVPFMRAFPRRLVLQPGQRQTLRVMVQPPADLAPGEHWGRVLVRSRGGQAPIEQTEGGVRMQIAVETVIATAVLFRKGDVTTGIAVSGVQAAPAPGGVSVSMDLARQNAGAFLGRIVAEVLDAQGRVVGQAEEPVSVYRVLRRRFTIPVQGAAPGAGFSLRWRVDTDRPDLPPPGPLQAPPVTGTIPVR